MRILGPARALTISRLAVVALLATAAHPACAQEESRESELAPGDTAFGQEKGDLELAFETGYNNGVDADEFELRLGLEYGITNRVQVSFDLPYLFVNPDDPGDPNAHGWDAAQIGLQLGLLGVDEPLALSLGLEADVPLAGREGPGSDDTKVAVAVLLARVWGSRELFGDARATRTDGPTEVALQVGGVFVRGRLAFELATTWTDTGDDTEWGAAT